MWSELDVWCSYRYLEAKKECYLLSTGPVDLSMAPHNKHTATLCTGFSCGANLIAVSRTQAWEVRHLRILQ